MIPKNITKNDILKAIEYMDKNLKEKTGPFKSRTYDVLFKNKRYPPKRVISLANKFRNGEELSHEEFSSGEGSETFTFLENLGFKIVLKSGAIPIENIYAIMTYNEKSIDKITVKLGRTGNIEQRITSYKTNVPELKLLGLWEMNADSNKNQCENGILKLAGQYTCKRISREIFIFTSKPLTNFIENVDLLLKKAEPPKSVEKYVIDLKDLG